MKKSIFLLLALPLLLVGCKKNEVVVLGEPVTVKPTTVSPEACYVYDKDGTAISLQIKTTGEEVTGTMEYAIAEKDKNTGAIKGKWINNILLLDYTFQSEGKESTRQVAFQLKDNQLIEGYGEMNEDGTQFKEVSQLKFTSTMPLSKTNCPK